MKEAKEREIIARLEKLEKDNEILMARYRLDITLGLKNKLLRLWSERNKEC